MSPAATVLSVLPERGNRSQIAYYLTDEAEPSRHHCRYAHILLAIWERQERSRVSESITILHLSDLHFCPQANGVAARELIEQLHNDINMLSADHGLEPDLVAFSGDLSLGETEGKSPTQIEQLSRAYDLLIQPLIERFSQLRDTNRIHIVPGNHDVSQSLASDNVANYVAQAAASGEQGILELASHFVDGTQRWDEISCHLDPYRQFLEEKGLHHLLQDPKRLLASTKLTINSWDVEVHCANTAWSCFKGSSKGGTVVAFAKLQLKQLLKTSQSPSPHLRVAMFHHPPHWLLGEQEDVRDLLRDNYDLILHGHEHSARVADLSPTCHRVMAGALYVGRSRRTGYRVIRLYPEDDYMELWQRTYEERYDTGWVEDYVRNQTDEHGMIAKRPQYHSKRKGREAIDRASQRVQEIGSRTIKQGVLVVSLDLQRFTQLPDLSQYKLSELFWQRLVDESSPLGQAIINNKMGLLPRSDGCVLVESSPGSISTRDLSDGLTWLMQQVEHEGPRLRAAVHVGTVFKNRPRPTRVNYSGTAINEVRTMCFAADTGQVVYSNAFIDWSGIAPGTSAFGTPLEDLPEPVTLYQSPGRALEVHWEQIAPGARESAQRLENMHRLDEQVDEALDQLLATCEEWIANRADVPADKNILRISILSKVAAAHGTYLTATLHRVSNFSNVPLGRSRTRYSLSGKGQGLPGRAFRSKSVQALFDLPDPRKHFDLYSESFSDVDVTADHIVRWQRRARSFVAVPLAVDDQIEPDGVVCMDGSDGLARIATDYELQDTFLRHIVNCVEGELAFLWKLRITA